MIELYGITLGIVGRTSSEPLQNLPGVRQFYESLVGQRSKPHSAQQRLRVGGPDIGTARQLDQPFVDRIHLSLPAEALGNLEQPVDHRSLMLGRPDQQLGSAVDRGMQFLVSKRTAVDGSSVRLACWINNSKSGSVRRG